MPRRSLASVALLFSIFAGQSAAQTAAGIEVVSLVTRDGVQLKATYYRSAKGKGTPEAKQVTPVVLLHDYKSTRTAFLSLAQRLQSQDAGEKDRPSFTAITLDLRAHGDSTLTADGRPLELDLSRLRPQDYLAMVTFDMEAVRSFLVGKNDEGELNLDKLCVVGSGMGASVAASWAYNDWIAPPLAIGKQGQDVKALVLISPRWLVNGLSFQGPMKLRPLKENVAWLLMYGAEDNRARAEVQRIYKQLERFHPAPDPSGKQPSSLRVLDWPSKLQADALVKQVGTKLDEQIIEFLVDQVAKKQHPWTSRRTRLPGQ